MKKYQYILDGKTLFETDSVSEFFGYLMYNKDASQGKNAILFDLLDKADGYICNMSDAVHQRLP